MGENLESIILKYSPNWKDGNGIVLLEPSSSEFMEMAAEIVEACPHAQIKRIRRNENTIHLGQFLLQEQHILLLEPHETFHRERRYFKINSCDLEQALQHNLDHRRIGGEQLQFHQKLHNLITGDTVLIILCLNKDLKNNIFTPNQTMDYFIEYVVDF